MASAEVVITAGHVVVHGGEQRGARGVGIELAGLYQRPKIVVGHGNVVRRDAKKVANTLERGMAGVVASAEVAVELRPVDGQAKAHVGNRGVVAAQQAQIGHKFIMHGRDSRLLGGGGAANVPPCAQECNGSPLTPA